MTDMNPDIEKDQTSDEVTVETTSVFRADFLSELDAPAQAGTESAVSGSSTLFLSRCARAKANPRAWVSCQVHSRVLRGTCRLGPARQRSA